MDIYSLTVDMYVPSGQPGGIYSSNYRLHVSWDPDVLLGVYLEVIPIEGKHCEPENLYVVAIHIILKL